MDDKTDWDLVVRSRKSLWSINLGEVWNYRDLLFLLVKRDILAFYKQTVLGPIWFFIQPLFTMSVYVFVFGNLAGLSTAGLPKPIFYLVGITFWTYFSQTLLKTSTILKDNIAMLGKVYFPRVIMPLSLVLSNMFRLGVQFTLLIAVSVYFLFQGFVWEITWYLALLPLLILFLAIQALGLGMIVSALTTKYRDLALLLTFGIQLLMYATPVVYPLESLEGTPKLIVQLNPVSLLMEGFRKSMYNEGQFGLDQLGIVSLITLAILAMGVLIFNKVEQNFVDTV